MTTDWTRAAVVLTGGASRRMGRDKSQLTFVGPDGQSCSFLERACDLARVGVPKGPVVVVSGPDVDTTMRSFDNLRLVENPAPERGMFSSLQVGLRASLEGTANPAVMLLLIDHPLVAQSTIKRLWGSYRHAPWVSVVPRCKGELGHPVVLAADTIKQLVDADPSSRLDTLMKPFARKTIELRDAGIITNINTPELYEKFFGLR